MAHKNTTTVKSTILVIFIATSLLLIVGVWFEGLAEKGATAPGHVRPTLSIATPQGVDLTYTPDPNQPTREHRNGDGHGGGSGGAADHSTPTPAINVDNYPTEDLPADLRDE